MTDDEARDAIAALKAQFDQFREAAVELAKTMAAYHEELLEQGLDAPTALALTIGYQASLLSMVGRGDSDA